MKKTVLLLLSTIILQCTNAQNVGVGTLTPAEKLDVNGNIKVSGEIMPNGLSGSNGQVLVNNGSGGMNWVSSFDFKNILAFTDPVPASIPWIVPANVTKVWVEAWGGGGAGLFAGGGSGGYLSMVFNVTAGQTFNFRVGKGGLDNPTSGGGNIVAQSGTDSYIYYAPNNYNYYAGGGGGANNNTANPYEINTPGLGGKFLTNAPVSSPQGPFFYQSGQPGNPVRLEYSNASSNMYFLNKFWGNGGLAPNVTGNSMNAAISQYAIIITPSSNTLVNYSSANGGIFPGGGGGGGDTKGLGTFETRAGANGMVIVHY